MGPSRGAAAETRRRLDIGDALHEGWSAFRRAPWSFLGFEMVVLVLQLAVQPLLAGVLGAAQGQGVSSADWMLFALGMALSFGLDGYATVGLVRGSWQALGGERPSLGSLLRWDGAGWQRVLKARLLLGIVLALPLLLVLTLALATTLIAGLVESWEPGRSQELLALPALLVTVLAALLLALMVLMLVVFTVNQQFLAPIALLERQPPWATIQRGRALADPQFLLLLVLLVLKLGLLLLGLLSFSVGLLLAWPVVICISTAAYRQLVAPGEAAPPANPPAPTSPPRC